jgi:hypothetical protein
MATLTAANAILLIGVDSVFPTPQQLQGFAADDVTDVESLASAEAVMGVDGNLSAGFVFVSIKQGITLQSDSASNFLFDTWYLTQQQAKDVFPATGVLMIPGLGTKWTMSTGWLTGYKPFGDIKRIVQPRKFEITWASISPAVIGS